MLASYGNWLFLIEIMIIFAQIDPKNCLNTLKNSDVHMQYTLLCEIFRKMFSLQNISHAKYFAKYSKPIVIYK